MEGLPNTLFTIGAGEIAVALSGSELEGCGVVHKMLTWKRLLIHNLFFFNVLGHFLFDKHFIIHDLTCSSLEEIWQFAAAVFGPPR